jgi:predicted peptidase
MCNYLIAPAISAYPADSQRVATDFQGGVFSDSLGGVLIYRLFIPSDIDPEKRYPLVTFLHGRGRKGDDNKKQLTTTGAFVWAEPERQNENTCFVLAPQCPSNDGWSRPESLEGYGPSTPIKTLLGLIDTLVSTYSIDPDRLYITGQSGGGGGTLKAITTQPHHFAAAVLVCPGGRHTPEQMAILAPGISHLPLWFFHGGEDKIIPVTQSRHWIKALRAAGSDPIYIEYVDEGHDCWNKAYIEPKLSVWLFTQHRQ